MQLRTVTALQYIITKSKKALPPTLSPTYRLYYLITTVTCFKVNNKLVLNVVRPKSWGHSRYQGLLDISHQLFPCHDNHQLSGELYQTAPWSTLQKITSSNYTSSCVYSETVHVELDLTNEVNVKHTTYGTIAENHAPGEKRIYAKIIDGKNTIYSAL